MPPASAIQAVMSVREPQRTEHCPQSGVALSAVRAHPQYEQSEFDPEHIGSAALGLSMKNGQREQSQPRAGVKMVNGIFMLALPRPW
ncbi:hypothetical protein [Mycobacteroides abscessus]|uniref:hypothetical protein n=2 Tax=Mycobacteroides abscessus TaxID=36809 RepID=UPI001A98B37D|nr:hypothetical protein [Mycobacteroides abscessus]